METIEIKLVDIIADKRFNARYSDDENIQECAKAAQTIDELAKSIARDGQITPIIVGKSKKGGFDLIAGFRRYKALVSLKKDTAYAIVIDPATQMDAYLLNLQENMARKDLTNFEVARRCTFLISKNDALRKGGRAKKGTVGTLARDLGISQRYLNRLIKAHTCHPKIITAWAKGDGRCTVRQLEKWSSLKPAEQLRIFAEEGGEVEIPGGTPSTPDAPEKNGAPKRPNKNTVSLALTAATSANTDTRYKQGVIAALQWVNGDSVDIKDIFDPKTIITAKEKQRAEKLAAKKESADRKAIIKLAARKKKLQEKLAAMEVEIED